MDEPINFNSKSHSYLVPQFVKIHQQCITSAPYTISTFLPPLDTTIMHKWWEARVQEAIEDNRFIIMQFARNEMTGEEELVGYVMLWKPFSHTGSFRGIVEKLLVSPEHRRKGIAKRLMGKLESVAKEARRTMLLLDTETGSSAEVIYPRLGYIQVGKIPDYGISPYDGSLKAGTFFYKNLLTSANHKQALSLVEA